LRPFSFVHAADLHLGYEQYNLEARREDFVRAFEEIVEKTLELKPDFMIVAGDIFHHARPANVTLENAIRNFRRLKNAGIPVLAVDGSHDRAPNIVTGTILNPLDTAGLLYHLPRHKGASWRSGDCYVYGIPNFRSRSRAKESLPAFLNLKKPTPNPSGFNIFVFHMAVEVPAIMRSHPRMEAEATAEMIPEGFNYYAGGHIHTPWQIPFKGGLLVYSGCTETVSYEDAKVRKGFYYVEVDGDGEPNLTHIELESPRRFIVFDEDYSGLMPSMITDLAAEAVKRVDEPGVVIIPILRGVLPAESTRREIDLAKIRSAAEKALLVRPVVQMRETGIPEEVIRAIFEGGLKDLKGKVLEFFLEFFSQRYPKEEAERNARLALKLINPLTRGDDKKVREIMEGSLLEG